MNSSNNNLLLLFLLLFVFVGFLFWQPLLPLSDEGSSGCQNVNKNNNKRL